MSFRVIFSTKSSKKIRSLDSDLKERIKNAIEEISSDPWKMVL
jgi:mRNA-degrading endonuclease RelE of RelBE toxin-antitoxin system